MNLKRINRQLSRRDATKLGVAGTLGAFGLPQIAGASPSTTARAGPRDHSRATR